MALGKETKRKYKRIIAERYCEQIGADIVFVGDTIFMYSTDKEMVTVDFEDMAEVVRHSKDDLLKTLVGSLPTITKM